MKNRKRKIIMGTILFCIITIGFGFAATYAKRQNQEGNNKSAALQSKDILSDFIGTSFGKPTVSSMLDKAFNMSIKTSKEPGKNTPIPREKPKKKPKPTITPVPSKTDEHTEEFEKANKKVIAIDAGHQKKGNPEKEPIGPGSKVKKAKVSSGTTGVSTNVAEYKLTLEVSLKLKEELEDRGYEVIMIREKHDVNISNAERAKIANEQADIFLRIHANGSENQTVSGALTIYPSKNNEFAGSISKECKKLSKAVIDAFCESTGAKNRGAIVMDNMSGINWCTVPVTIVEMGFMTNPEEDKKMQQEKYQDKMVQGIANGVDTYFAE